MKLGLYENVKKYVDAYHANSDSQREAIKAALEPFKTPSYADRFTQEGLRQTIKESLDAINADWKKYDKTMNDAVKAAVGSANEKLFAALNAVADNQIPDKAIKIANAREFLKDELDAISGELDSKQIAELDSSIYMILKDFIDDYDTMKLFSKMVEKKVILIGATGEPSLPKTFGKMMKVDGIMNTLVEVMEASTMLFLHNRTNGQEVIRIHGDAYALPMDGYSEEMDEQAALDNAQILDDLADAIDEDGHSQASGEGQKM